VRNGVAYLTGSESFKYDPLHRLTQVNINAGGATAAIDYGYDNAGNFTHKSDYSANNAAAYQYLPQSNKVSQVTLKDNTMVSFGYDNTGNQTSQTTPSGVNHITYNSVNKPLTINKNGAGLTFTYGADLARYKQQRALAGNTITTHYIDKHYEVEITDNHTTTKSYISDVAIIADGAQADDRSIHFTLRDRLGSTTTFADHNGNAVAYRYYDPFGKPRSGDWSLLSGLGLTPILANNPLDSTMPTRKGFTDHEHLDEVELIHMNGRVYDYNLGRFLSVDPFIQSPTNSQSLNPYSYIMNNPLSGTDPTGYRSEPEEKVVTLSTTGSHIKKRVTVTASSSDSVSITGGNGADRAQVAGMVKGAVDKISSQQSVSQ
jgi:RHS repeat-associated protein